MHENHRRPLRKARRDYSKLDRALTYLIARDREYRENYHHQVSIGMTGRYWLEAIKANNILLLECIEELQGAAEVLEIVEYVLRRA